MTKPEEKSAQNDEINEGTLKIISTEKQIKEKQLPRFTQGFLSRSSYSIIILNNHISYPEHYSTVIILKIQESDTVHTSVISTEQQIKEKQLPRFTQVFLSRI